METKIDIINTVAKNIKFLRKNTRVEESYIGVKKMSQQLLAQCLGSIPQQISKFELGKNELRASQLYKISKIFDITTDSLFDSELPNKYYSKIIKHDIYD